MFGRVVIDWFAWRMPVKLLKLSSSLYCTYACGCNNNYLKKKDVLSIDHKIHNYLLRYLNTYIYMLQIKLINII